MIHRLWQRYPDVYQQLEQTQNLLAARATSRDPAINALIQAQIHAGGKMLRSGLVFMLARFHDGDNRQLTYAAAAIEALHLATLVHDDVLDHAAERRGEPTIQAVLANRTAIYAGDFLFSVYFDLLAEAAPDVTNVGTNARTMRRIFLGELDQNGRPQGPDMTVHRYLREIGGKTAALFALATYQGMRLSHAPHNEVVSAYRYGRLLGMSFQMIDDLLDYTGTTKLAKPRLEDLSNGIYTLPALYALAVDPTLASLTEAATTDPVARQQAAKQIIQNGVPAAKRLAEKYTAKAIAAGHQLPAGSARSDLIILTQGLLDRDH